MSYSQKEIDAALRFKNNSRKIDFQYDLLDKYDTYKGRLDGISGTINFSAFAAIKRTATFDFNEYLQRNIDYLSDRIQPYMILYMPDGGTVRFPLGIFLLASPNRKINGNFKTREIVAYDKTLILEEDKFTERYFIAKDTSYVEAIEKILSTAGITRVNIQPSNSVLRIDKEYEAGTSKKEVINDLLNQMNYDSIYIDENGYFRASEYILPSDRPINHIYIADEASVLTPDAEESLDTAGVANVFTRVVSNPETSIVLTSTFVNDKIESATSTVSRGRKITDIEKLDNIASQEALDNLVIRIANNATSKYSHLLFGTALMPIHGNQDTIYIDNKDISDTPIRLNETAWTMPLEKGAIMTHEARKVVFL